MRGREFKCDKIKMGRNGVKEKKDSGKKKNKKKGKESVFETRTTSLIIILETRLIS